MPAMIEHAAAYAKVNLSLDIISKRDDGYHDLVTVMQSIDLCDDISVECLPGEGLTIQTNLPYLPNDERNIAAKAALAFFKYTNINGYRTHINIVKRIPVSAGLGGGSADAACILRVLDNIFGTELGVKTLETIGESIGSDVPFCIAGGTVLARGKGEVMTDLPPIPQSHVLVCKPSFSCSTPELFALVKCEKIRARPDTDGIIDALEKGNLRGIAQRMYNVFEDILPRGAREIDEIKSKMLDNGALGAVMTGSGPTVFGIFDEENMLKKAHEALITNYNNCFKAETIGRQVKKEM